MGQIPGYRKARARLLTCVVDDPEKIEEINEVAGILRQRVVPKYPNRRMILVANRRVLFDDDCAYHHAPILTRVDDDTRRKVVTMQIALPGDESQRELGTEFYRRSRNPLTLTRPPRGFTIARRMDFLPNTAYAFSVLNTFRLKSWHGRSTIPDCLGVRNSILNIWYEKAADANPDLIEENRQLESRSAFDSAAA
jgi:hypothetical protein